MQNIFHKEDKNNPHLIAIIPAKTESLRCPDKNTRLLQGIPLFMHSVNYALREGVTPVVSTDSDKIFEICANNNILAVRERVDDAQMGNCILQVLEQIPCDMFVLLQPTSPLRKPGLLRQMCQDMINEGSVAAVTVQKIKMVGILDGKVQMAYREQDAGRFFSFYDGNIYVYLTQSFLTHGLFHEDMRPYGNEFPCYLQIDVMDEFVALDHLASLPEFKQLVHLTPSCSIALKKVCIISNKLNLERDYSPFVDSCDVVIRINKMDNIDSRLTGSRTDMALVSFCSEYLAFSARERHLERLKQVPELYFNSEEVNFYSHDVDETTQFARQEAFKNWQFIPNVVHRCTPNLTTLSKGVCLADYLYPEDQIYYLGDVDASLRVPESLKHPHAIETAYLQDLIKCGRVIPILEERELDLYIYSRSSALRNRVINCSHPDWKDQFQIVGRRGVRLHCNDAAHIIEDTAEGLFVKWDTWGAEYFKKTAPGLYAFQKRPLKRVGFLRILNEENTIIACILSVAPLFDVILLMWSSDMTDASIELAKKWESTIKEEYDCQLIFLYYPHHVDPPHSVDDLCTLPLENQIGTYYNYGMDAIKAMYRYEPYLMVKIDGDQIYFTEEFAEALKLVTKPDDCVAVRGHNTAVHHHTMVLYTPRPINGGGDYIICGSENLPSFITAPLYEADTTDHSHVIDYPLLCWMHFMRSAKYGTIIRSFNDEEVGSLSQYPELLEKYRKYILPLLEKSDSPYSHLKM